MDPAYDDLKPGLYKLCLSLYAIYFLSMVMQLAPQTMALGSISMIIGIILVYAQRRKAKGTIFESHFHWLYRTFWIAGGVYLPLTTIIGAGVMFSYVDMASMNTAIEAGSDMETLKKVFMEQNETLIWVSAVISVLPVAIWWFWRCYKGYTHLKFSEPVSDVMSWL